MLNQTVARLQQELTGVKASLQKKNEELATITEDLGAKEALLTDTKNKELQVVLHYLYSEVSVALTNCDLGFSQQCSLLLPEL
jgi:hypothetical protein